MDWNSQRKKTGKKVRRAVTAAKKAARPYLWAAAAKVEHAAKATRKDRRLFGEHLKASMKDLGRAARHAAAA